MFIVQATRLHAIANNRKTEISRFIYILLIFKKKDMLSV